MNSKVTRAEAYDAEEELLDVRFRFDSGVTAGGDCSLQNRAQPVRRPDPDRVPAAGEWRGGADDPMT